MNVSSPTQQQAHGSAAADLLALPQRIAVLCTFVLLFFVAAQAHAALTLATSINPKLARPGEVVEVEMTVTNTDAIARTNVTVSIVYPTGLNSAIPGNFNVPFNATCPPNFCEPGETITWTLGTLQPGRSITVDLPTSVAAATADGTIINFNFTATDSTLQVANSTSTLTVETATLFDVALRESADPVKPGADLTYKLTWGYREEALILTTGTLTLPVPAGTTFVSATGGGALVGGTVQWDLGLMTPGDGGAREVTVHVNAPDNTVIPASAQVFETVNPANQAGAEALTVVDAAPLLSIDVDANPDPARLSEQLNLQLVVTNHDSITRLNLTLRVRYPDSLFALPNTNINGGSCPPNNCDAGEQAVFTIASLAAGQSVTLELAPFVLNTVSDGTLLNFSAILTDPTGGNASSIDTVRVRNAPNYDVSIRDSADPIKPAAQLTYKLTYGYRNEALVLAFSTLRFRLPQGTSFVSASDGGVFASGAVTWDVGLLNPGDGGNREVIVQVNAADTSVLQASAEVFDASKPIEQAGAEALTIVDATPPISLDIDANYDPVRINELMSVHAIVTNHDAIPRTLTLRIRYPDGLFAEANGNINGGSCPPNNCDAGEIFTTTAISVAAGSSMLFELPVFALNTVVDGQLINFYATLNDTAGGNASGFDSVRVNSSARFDLALRESVDPVAPGALLTYKLEYGYRNDALNLANTTLRMRLPPGTTFVSATGGGTLNGSDVDWDLGTFNPADGGFRELTVQVNATDANVLQAAAEIFDRDNPVEAASAEASTIVDSFRPLEIQIDVNADPVRPSAMMNATYIVTNHDAVPRIVTLRGRYPDNLFATANGNIAWNTPGSCPPNNCDQGEIITWTVGSIPAGHSITVELPPFPLNTAVGGSLINFFAIATDTVGGVASAEDTVRVSADTRYTLALRDSADPAAPGGELTYKLTFGYRQDAPFFADTGMRFRLAPGTSFVSATGGGVLVGDTVVWDLGSLNPGDGGIRAVRVNVDAGSGNVLQAQAEIYSTASPVEQAQAEALTVVGTTRPLALDIIATTNPSQPNGATTVTLTVTNLDAVQRTVTLRARYPDGVFSVSPVNFTPDGSCPPNNCDPSEMVTWALGTIPAGGNVVVTMPMTVLNTAINGQLINVFGIVTDTAGGIATGIDTIRIGLCTDDDSDCDSVPDSADNCILVDNSTQRDTDEDGIGNFCDPDLTQDCSVNFADLGIFKSAFFTTDPDSDFDGSGQVNFVDLGILKEFFFRPPGPSGVPNDCD